MTITDGYCTLDELKSWLRSSLNLSDAILEANIESASRMIDRFTGHQFYPQTSATARVFTACHLDLIEVDDISSTTGLIVKTDQNYDGTFEYTWSASTDYQLEPLNNLTRGRAVWRIRRKQFGTYWFPVSDEALVQVTAKWGWPAIPDQVKTACLIQAARLVNRRDSALGFVQSPEIGSSDRLRAQMDPDAMALLAPFQRHETPL